MVRDMMDWFAGREDFSSPDERTVRRMILAIWRELNSVYCQYLKYGMQVIDSGTRHSQSQ
jgi:hypothetical protein